MALRQGTGTAGALTYLSGDHLGSVSLATSAIGTAVSESRYKPFGETHWTSGAVVTDFGYTGQRRDGTGLMDYHARFYDGRLGRFLSPDTLVPDPGNPLDWDRFAYVRGNPLRYVDPSGHYTCDDESCAQGFPELVPAAEPEINTDDLNDGVQEGGEIYNLYQQLNSVGGWWNSNIPGSMAIEEFLGIMLLIEVWGEAGAVSLIIEAATYNLWMDDPARMSPRIEAYCSVDPCGTGIFNFMGDQFQVAKTRVGHLELFNTVPKLYNPGLALAMGYKVMHPHSIADFKPYNSTRPNQWGNHDYTIKWPNVIPQVAPGGLSIGGYRVFYHRYGTNFVIWRSPRWDD